MIYPGVKIWFKRWRHIATLSMVSFTITVQSLQDAVVKKSIALATTLQEQQETITTGLQTVLYAKSWYDWLLVQVGFEDDTTENEAVEALS